MSKRDVAYSTPLQLSVQRDGTQADPVFICWDSEQSHYHYILNIQAFCSNGDSHERWCGPCQKMVRKEWWDTHTCEGIQCNKCRKKFDCQADKDAHLAVHAPQKCPDCNFYYANDECLAAHKENKLCTGQKSYRHFCYSCKKKVPKAPWQKLTPERVAEHQCGEYWCGNCDKFVVDEHQCFITPLKPKEKDKEMTSLWVYDFESRFNHEGYHEVNYIYCKNRETGEIKEFGRPGMKPNEALDQFIQWATSLKNTTMMAHNAKAYDGWLTHLRLVHNTGHRPDNLMLVGQKVMYMTTRSVKWMDSCNHLPFPLKAAPAAFGFDDHPDYGRKGDYPYKFNTQENEDYIGPMPPLKDFPIQMNQEAKEKLEKWHTERSKTVWDNWHELTEYCKTDVDILCEALTRYSKMQIELSGIEPLNSITIAGYALKVYRTNHMQESIPLLSCQRISGDLQSAHFMEGGQRP